MCQPSSVMSNGSPRVPVFVNWIARGKDWISTSRPIAARFTCAIWAVEMHSAALQGVHHRVPHRVAQLPAGELARSGDVRPRRVQRGIDEAGEPRREILI